MAGALLALCLLLIGVDGARAEPPATVFLEELTWTELRDLIHAGKTTIIVPIGGTEQNGPHMALGKHNRRVEVLSEKIARALGNALVAPVVAYVPEGDPAAPSGHLQISRHHHRFAGGVRAGPRRGRAQLQARGLSRHRPARRPWRLSARRSGGRRQIGSGMGGDPGAGACDRGILPGERNRIRPIAEEPRLRRGGDRQACGASRHLADAGDRSAPRPPGSSTLRARRGRQRRSAPRQRRSRAARRRADRGADGRRHQEGGRAR